MRIDTKPQLYLYLTLVKIACFQASGGRCGWKPHLQGTHVATWRSLLQKTQLLTVRSIIICCLMFTFHQHVASAQQPKFKKESAEDFVKLGIPLEEALTKTTFVVEWLSGDGSTEVNFQGENVIRTPDYIELPSDNNKDGKTDSYYRILSKYAAETNRYIFVPLDRWGGGSESFGNSTRLTKKRSELLRKSR